MEYKLGKNIVAKINGETLTLTVNLAKNLGPSNSGKSLLIATTRGNRIIPGHKKMRLGLTLFEYCNQWEPIP